MSVEVKGLTDVVKEISDVKSLASDVAQELRNNIEDLKESLSITREVSAALGKTGAELRAALGIQTNRPPTSEKG